MAHHEIKDQYDEVQAEGLYLVDEKRAWRGWSSTTATVRTR
jgi:hypothetical protein